MLDLQFSPFWQQWICLNTDMEEAISEIQDWEG